MTSPNVFISYSHDSAEHANRVLALANQMIQDGVDCTLDQYESSPLEGWPQWMDKHIRNADFVLMICTEVYFHRVMGEEETGKGLGVKWEGKLIYQHLYNADATNLKFIPVLFEYCKVEHIPTPLQGATRYCVDTPQGYEDLYRRLTDQPYTKKPKLGELRALPARERKQDFAKIASPEADELEAKFREKAMGCFRNHVYQILEMIKHSSELQSHPPIFYRLENFRCKLDSLRFLKQEDHCLYWMARVTATADGLWTDVASWHARTKPVTEPLRAEPPIPPTRISEAGRLVFEVIWSIRVTENDQLEGWDVKDIKCVETTWAHVDG